VYVCMCVCAGRGTSLWVVREGYLWRGHEAGEERGGHRCIIGLPCKQVCVIVCVIVCVCVCNCVCVCRWEPLWVLV